MVKRLAIIPARSGSKRIKDKNIKLFKKQPIINYTLALCKKSKMFNKIHISTDSDQIKKIVKKKGFSIDFMRPKKLSKKNIPLIDVAKFVFKEYKKLKLKFDQIWIFSACAPLLKLHDIIRAEKIFKKFNQENIVIPVCEYNAPIEWAFIMKKNKLHHFFKNQKKLMTPSQNLKKKYFDLGYFFVMSPKHLSQNFFNSKFSGCPIPKIRAVDIDDVDDWLLAEKLFQKNK